MKDHYINPFDDDKHSFLVLLNTLKQYSLWPQFAPVPSGWEVVFGPDAKTECCEYIEKRWVDIRQPLPSKES
ncbi:MbtH family protein [Vibrio tritonius]|uniref:MbtH family protein n=1 Tax=Vibrio tritonius TaxID=1435069 RepID=UPI00315DD02F